MASEWALAQRRIEPHDRPRLRPDPAMRQVTDAEGRTTFTPYRSWTKRLAKQNRVSRRRMVRAIRRNDRKNR